MPECVHNCTQGKQPCKLPSKEGAWEELHDVGGREICRNQDEMQNESGKSDWFSSKHVEDSYIVEWCQWQIIPISSASYILCRFQEVGKWPAQDLPHSEWCSYYMYKVNLPNSGHTSIVWLYTLTGKLGPSCMWLTPVRVEKHHLSNRSNQSSIKPHQLQDVYSPKQALKPFWLPLCPFFPISAIDY